MNTTGTPTRITATISNLITSDGLASTFLSQNFWAHVSGRIDDGLVGNLTETDLALTCNGTSFHQLHKRYPFGMWLAFWDLIFEIPPTGNFLVSKFFIPIGPIQTHSAIPTLESARSIFGWPNVNQSFWLLGGIGQHSNFVGNRPHPSLVFVNPWFQEKVALTLSFDGNGSFDHHCWEREQVSDKSPVLVLPEPTTLLLDFGSTQSRVRTQVAICFRHDYLEFYVQLSH